MCCLKYIVLGKLTISRNAMVPFGDYSFVIYSFLLDQLDLETSGRMLNSCSNIHNRFLQFLRLTVQGLSFWLSLKLLKLINILVHISVSSFLLNVTEYTTLHLLLKTHYVFSMRYANLIFSLLKHQRCERIGCKTLSIGASTNCRPKKSGLYNCLFYFQVGVFHQQPSL